jgi:hypothetical protein
VDLAITSSQAPYFENATNPRALPYTIFFLPENNKGWQIAKSESRKLQKIKIIGGEERKRRE